MDLSEVTKLENLQSTMLAPDVERKEITAKMLEAIASSIEKMIIASPELTREAERALLLKLADALEFESRDVRCVQVRKTEHLHTVSHGWLCHPLHLPALAALGPAEAETSIKVEYREQLVHYVCALGKLGVVLGNGPGAWRGLGIPKRLRDLIVLLNDGKNLSFRQIAAALRAEAL